MPRSLPRVLLSVMLLAGTAVVLGGCGFQPRGHAGTLADIPSPLHITGISAYSDLGRELAGQLQRAGVATSPTAADSALVLRIRDLESNVRVLTVDSRNRAVENELEESVRFDLRSADNRVVSEQQTVRVLRIQLSPSDTVLANSREATLLREDMLRELARRILQRVAAQH